MYASLDRMDISLEDDETGDRIAIQTDHREADEIEDDFDMSALFAITRALNPIRTGSADRVRFAHMASPPERYLALMDALGVEVEIMERSIRPASDGDPAEVDRIAAECLDAIAKRTLAGLGVMADGSGLLAAQASCRDLAFAFGSGPDDEPVSYWEAFVSLGAVTGLVLQGMGPLTWRRDPEFYGAVPYMIGQGSSLTNVFGKVERFFDEGDSQAPEHLLSIARDSQGVDIDASPVMYNLRPHDWAGIGHAWTRPLLPRESGESMEEDLPVVALVRDLPSSVASIPVSTDADVLEVLHAEADANLSRIQVEIERLEGDLELLIVHDSYYACEKLLDVAFMANLASQLDTELLMAAIPVKGRLLLANALAPPEHVAMLRGLSQRDYDEAPRADRLTPEILLWGDGKVVGFARLGPQEDEPEPEPEPPAKRSLWSRLFGGKG